MRELLVIILLLTIINPSSFSQNVGVGTNNPDPSAKFDIYSTNSGFLPPRMTCAQRDEIPSPAAGLIVYCTDCDSSGQPQFFNGNRWCNMLGGLASGILPVPANIPGVTIGTQVWATKNLDVAIYRNGDPIPQVTDPTEWANLTTGAWCWYNNDSATYGSVYGRLYNWYAVNDSRGLAPIGWHVPKVSEWNKMTKYLDVTVDTTCICRSGVDIGSKLKNTTGWNNGGNGTNSSEFAGLPGGGRDNSGSFYLIDIYGVWWSSNMANAALVWNFDLSYNSSSIARGDNSRGFGFSVRLVKD